MILLYAFREGSAYWWDTINDEFNEPEGYNFCSPTLLLPSPKKSALSQDTGLQEPSGYPLG